MSVNRYGFTEVTYGMKLPKYSKMFLKYNFLDITLVNSVASVVSIFFCNVYVSLF